MASRTTHLPKLTEATAPGDSTRKYWSYLGAGVGGGPGGGGPQPAVAAAGEQEGGVAAVQGGHSREAHRAGGGRAGRQSPALPRNLPRAHVVTLSLQ